MLDRLYKRTSTGAIQFWEVETDSAQGRYRTITGKQGGKQVVSEWTDCTPKNVGRSNATTATQQAVLEANAAWEKKQRDGYHLTVEEAHGSTVFWCMLAQTYETRRKAEALGAAGVGGLFSQPKLDGVRCLAKQKALWSRKNRPIVAVPHLLERVMHALEEHKGLVLDGELYHHDYRDDFNTVIRAVKKTKLKELDEEERALCQSMQYWIYDVAGGDLTKAPYSERQSFLAELIGDMTDGGDEGFILGVPTVLVQNEKQIDATYEGYLDKGFEGQILRVDGPYEPGKRSAYLQKRKEYEDAEFQVVRIHEGIGNRKGQAGFVEVMELTTGKGFKAGIKADKALRVKLLEERDKYVDGEVTVRFNGRTPDRIPRFPRAYAWYPGGRTV